MISSIAGNELASTSKVDREVKKTLGQEDFMRLLVTQLQYQDPLKPMEHTEFVTQLSQFSSLDHLAGINSGLKTLTGGQTDMNNRQVVNFIGKNIMASGNRLSMDGIKGSTGIGYQLNDDASEVVIRIINEDNKTVRSINAGPQDGGIHTAVWDGRDNSGNIMPAGGYTFEVSAKDLNGKEMDIRPNITGAVDGVSYENDVPYLMIQGMRIPLTDIEEVRDVKI
ncbi:MAG: hypothetical protein IT393_10055 [Nitrospirae bacterium]|nr:hypothetical protein [Nitrospirota bacterium]